MTAITVFLTAQGHARIFRVVRSEADAINRIRSAKVVQFQLAVADGLGALDEVFAVTNDVVETREQDLAAADYRIDGETRSLSVGDIVHIEGLGIFSVGPVGWQRHDHRLTTAAAARAVRVAYGLTA